MRFEMLTNRDVLDPDAELAIRIQADPESKTLTISDNGVGMTRDELVENLGTIAHSGVRAFIETAKDGTTQLSDVIGQFGVGFYSVFMVAESVRVTSRSFRPDAEAAQWFATGEETYTRWDLPKNPTGAPPSRSSSRRMPPNSARKCA
jgi:molecular chaperone HtpG